MSFPEPPQGVARRGTQALFSRKTPNVAPVTAAGDWSLVLELIVSIYIQCRADSLYAPSTTKIPALRRDLRAKMGAILRNIILCSINNRQICSSATGRNELGLPPYLIYADSTLTKYFLCNGWIKCHRLHDNIMTYTILLLF